MSPSFRRLRLAYPSSIVFSIIVLLVTFHDATFTKTALVRINQLPIQVEYRVKQWDWKDTDVETTCRNQHQLAIGQQPIPNIVHFILLAKEGMMTEMTFPTFLAIKSALLRMNASEIKLHTYGINQNNLWWNKIKGNVTHVQHDRFAQLGPGSRDLQKYSLAHQSDFLRLDIMRREGGIYLDTDVYPLKPFTDLLNSSKDTLLGHEGGNRYGLCNAVIVSRPGSEFIAKWQASYASFNDHIWNEHSVRLPKQLSVEYPELVCPLSPSVFFWPTWAAEHTESMHEALSAAEAAEFRLILTENEGSMYSNQLAYHNWGGGRLDLHSRLTPDFIQHNDTRFNLLVRDVHNSPI